MATNVFLSRLIVVIVQPRDISDGVMYGSILAQTMTENFPNNFISLIYVLIKQI